MIIGICDDNKIHRDMEEKICRDVVNKSIDDESSSVDFILYEDGETVLNDECKLDILIIDIEMKGITGIDVKKELELRREKTIIIFVTSYEEYVYDAFGLNVHGFVRKTDLNVQLSVLFCSAYNMLINKRNIRIKDKYDSENVMAIIVEHVYCILIMNDKSEHSVRSSINELEEKLKSADFMRISRNILINMSYIKRLRENVITMTDDKKYVVSVRRLNHAKERYREYCEINGRF